MVGSIRMSSDGVAPVGEPPLGHVELGGADPEVEEDPAQPPLVGGASRAGPGRRRPPRPGRRTATGGRSARPPKGASVPVAAATASGSRSIPRRRDRPGWRQEGARRARRRRGWRRRSGRVAPGRTARPPRRPSPARGERPGSSAVPRPARCLRVECRDAHSGSRRRRILPEIRSRDCAWARLVRCARRAGPRRPGPTRRGSVGASRPTTRTAARSGDRRRGDEPLSSTAVAMARRDLPVARLRSRRIRRRRPGSAGWSTLGWSGLTRARATPASGVRPARRADLVARGSALRRDGGRDGGAPRHSAVVALGESLLLGQDLLVPGLPVPQFHPVDRPEHQTSPTRPAYSRSRAGMAIRPCRSISSSWEVDAHSRTRFRSLLPVAARSSIDVHLLLELVRASTATGSRPDTRSGSPPCSKGPRNFDGRITLPLSSSECSYLPKNRATGDCSHNAPRSAQNPTVRVPPFHTTLRHFTPHSPTGQPPGHQMCLPRTDRGPGPARMAPGLPPATPQPSTARPERPGEGPSVDAGTEPAAGIGRTGARWSEVDRPVRRWAGRRWGGGEGPGAAGDGSGPELPARPPREGVEERRGQRRTLGGRDPDLGGQVGHPGHGRAEPARPPPAARTDPAPAGRPGPRIPPEHAGAVEPGTVPVPALGQADHLPPVGGDHLARAHPPEAHQGRPSGAGHEALAVAAAPVSPSPGEGVHPGLTQPVEGPVDVGSPQPVTGRQPHVDPDRVPRGHQHRPPAGPPPDHRHPRSRGASGSTTAAGWVEPRTTDGPVTRQTATARRPGAASTAGHEACSAPASPIRSSTLHAPGTAPCPPPDVRDRPDAGPDQAVSCSAAAPRTPR